MLEGKGPGCILHILYRIIIFRPEEKTLTKGYLPKMFTQEAISVKMTMQFSVLKPTRLKLYDKGVHSF